MTDALTPWYEAIGIVVGAVSLVGGFFVLVRVLFHVRDLTLMVKGRPASQGVSKQASMVERFDAGDGKFDEITSHLERQDYDLGDLKRIVTNGLSTKVAEAVELTKRTGSLLQEHLRAHEFVTAADAAAARVEQAADSAVAKLAEMSQAGTLGQVPSDTEKKGTP